MAPPSSQDEALFRYSVSGDDKGCFRVQWQGKERTTPCILTSTKFLDAFSIKIGQYNVVERDGYLVSDCKTNPQDSL